MKLFQKLIKKEDGNVLYMTMIMMMVLVTFTLVLTNTIYIAALKVRAQNAADNMALSAATLKARVLNTTANYNSAIRGILELRGREGAPFSVDAEVLPWTVIILGLYGGLYTHIVKHNYDITHNDDISEIAKANGLDEEETELRLFPLVFQPSDIIPFFETRYVAMPVPHPVIMPAQMEPRYNLYVQSRVIWRTDDKIIGSKLLGIKPPDIVTRARAEIFDNGILKSPLGRNWRVRLVEPLDDVDEYIKKF